MLDWTYGVISLNRSCFWSNSFVTMNWSHEKYMLPYCYLWISTENIFSPTKSYQNGHWIQYISVFYIHTYGEPTSDIIMLCFHFATHDGWHSIIILASGWHHNNETCMNPFISNISKLTLVWMHLYIVVNISDFWRYKYLSAQ